MLSLDGIDRHSNWELVERIPLRFPTFHPQGLVRLGDRFLLSSVEISEWPQTTSDLSGVHRTTGRGSGHLFVLDARGILVDDIRFGEGDVYHPGGIDHDGESIWMPLAEYLPDTRSIVYTLDPTTLEVSERFRVADHIGWVVSDRANGLVYGGSWGSRRIYTWTAEGEELSRWENPSGFVDYQDCQYLGEGLILCSGITQLAGVEGPIELGGLAVIDPRCGVIVRELPVPVYSTAGHVITRNPFAAAADDRTLSIWVAPDDGDEGEGTEILHYRVALNVHPPFRGHLPGGG